MVSDRFKEVSLAQTAPRASHLSEQGPAAVCRMMLLPGPGGGSLQISYKSFTASYLFLKKQAVS